jgi:predicted metalloenzyme YecM
MHDIEKLIGNVDDFLTNILNSLNTKYNIDIKGKEIDHICFRCKTKEEYKQICKQIIEENLGEIVIESMIGGRPITIMKLHEPIKYNDFTISYLEIPCPKPGKLHHSGLEHCEVVIGDNDNNTTTNNKQFLESWSLTNYPMIHFNKKSINKDVNADICIDLDNNLNIKFHVLPLYKVIEYEKSLNLIENIPNDYF